MIILIYILCLVAIVYFLLIRPQRKRKKKLAENISSMKPGVQVVTVGGLHGEVVDKTEESVILRVKDGSELEFEIAAIAKVNGA